MSLRKAIKYGKEKRKPQKKFSNSCKNHGGCPYCENNRLYNDRRNRNAADLELKNYVKQY
jgi:hypothetical protein